MLYEGRIPYNGTKKVVPSGVVRISRFVVMVLGTSDLVNIPSDRLYVCTIPMYGCMDRRSCYNPETKIRDLGYNSCLTNTYTWMKQYINPCVFNYYEYVGTCLYDMISVSDNPDHNIKVLQDT